MLVCSLQNVLNALIFSKKKSKTSASLSLKREGGQRMSLSVVLKTNPPEPPAPPRAHYRHQTSRRLHALALAWSSVYILINYVWADGWRATSFHLFEPASIIVSWWWHLQPLQNISNGGDLQLSWGKSNMGVCGVVRSTQDYTLKTHKRKSDENYTLPV